MAYLETEWGEQSKVKFLKKLQKEFDLLSSHPFRCKRTETFPDLLQCIITTHTSAIYQVNELKSKIEVVTIFDNRQDPKKTHIELKSFFGGL